MYPKRPPYFAHKFCRQLIKQAVAQEIGPEGFCLLTCVAMTEDAKGYTGAVTFFNGQLMPLFGFTTEKRLISVRQKCVDSGWLHYEQGGKGVAGKYWCVMPSAARSDGPVDENPAEFALSNSTGEVQGNDRRTTGKVTGQVQENDRTKTGEPTVILPIPKPIPKPVPSRTKALSQFTTSARPGGDCASVMQWGKTRDDADLLNDSKIDEIFGTVVACGFAHDTDEDRQRFAALVFNLRRQGSAKFGLLTRIIEGRVKSKFAKSTDWRIRATEADHDRARLALKALDGLEAAS